MKQKQKQTIYIFIFLALFWIINSNIFTPFLLISGITSVLGTISLYTFFIKISKIEFEEDLFVFNKISNFFTSIKNIFFLIKDIAFYSIRLIFKIIKFEKINSSILKLSPDNIDNDFKLMIISHSITMTPGSISIFQDNKIIYIHCFDEGTANDIKKIGNFELISCDR